MKIQTSQTPPNFTPVSITITFETQKELGGILLIMLGMLLMVTGGAITWGLTGACWAGGITAIFIGMCFILSDDL